MDRDVPYIVFEGEQARSERHIKRLWITIIILIALLVLTNIGWLWYESQFEEMTITQENTRGFNSFIGGDGDIFNGETDSQGQTS